MTGIMQSALGNWNVPSAAAAASLVYNLDGTLGALPGASITTSASFNGSTQNLSVSNSTALNPGTGDFTIEFWTYLNSTTNNASFYRGNNNGVDVFMNGSGRLAMGQAQIATLITDSVTMTTGAWVHVAVVRSSGTTTLYKNGTSVGSAGDSNNYVTDSVNYIGTQGSLYVNGYISNLRVVIGTAVYTTAFTPPTVTLRAIAGTALLLPLTATPFTDMSTNLLAVTNTGTTVTSAQAPTLTAATTDFTGTYTITTANAGASVSYNSANGGVFAKSNATGTDVIYGGPNYVTAQSYTVFMAYQLSATSAGRLLNTQSEAVKDWLMGAYNGNPNTFYPNFSVNLPSTGADTAWHFGWATWDTTTSTGQLWIATNTQPTTYTYTATNGAGGGFNQLRLFSRSSGSEVQSGNIGFVKVYNGVLSTATIQAQYAAFKTRFGY